MDSQNPINMGQPKRTQSIEIKQLKYYEYN